MNKHVVKQLTKEGCIVEKDAAEALTEEDIEAIRSLDTTPMYITESMLTNLREKEVVSNGGTVVKQKTGERSGQDGSNRDQEPESGKLNSSETEKTSEEYTEKDQSSDVSTPVKIMDDRDRKEIRTKVEIVDDKEISITEKGVPEFLQYYNDRYDAMKKLLMNRMEMQSATTINRLERRNEGDEATTIGLVNDKYSTNSGKWIVEIEDNTESFKVLVDEREGERIVPDEVIGVIGSMGGDIIYADSIVRPDMPIPSGIKTTEDDVEAAYISDLHLGSKDTSHKAFDRFAKWLNSKAAEKVGYLVIPGDVVEGVGTYPGQEHDLEVTDIYKQYRLFEEWVERIPEHIQIVVSPGNHDITRLAEPQPSLPEKALPTIKDYNNVHLVQNPQTVRLHGIEGKGIVNLLYHGTSFDGHVDQIKDLREKAYEEPHHVMIDLLKRRHLAPTFGTNSVSPEEKDHLVIREEPDVFVTGHFHSHSNENYKGTNVINASSFQKQTDFQRRVGHEPDPGKVTVVNYKTRNTRVKKFI